MIHMFPWRQPDNTVEHPVRFIQQKGMAKRIETCLLSQLANVTSVVTGLGSYVLDCLPLVFVADAFFGCLPESNRISKHRHWKSCKMKQTWETERSPKKAVERVKLVIFVQWNSISRFCSWVYLSHAVWMSLCNQLCLGDIMWSCVCLTHLKHIFILLVSCPVVLITKLNRFDNFHFQRLP